MPTSPWNLPYPGPSDHTRTWEYWQALADATNTALSTIDNKVGSPGGSLSTWSPTVTGITIGNAGQTNYQYRIFGGMCYIRIRITAAASAPTTAFTGFVGLTTPPAAPNLTDGFGTAFYRPSTATYRLLGAIYTASTGNLSIDAVKQSDLSLGSPAAVWGSAAWQVGAFLQASIMYPI